ncbi:MAG: dethiobiotin synthase [Thermodesulfobacteriota bacterium]
MKKAFFITGTGTNAGKTFFAASLALTLKKKGLKIGVMKPIETGCALKGGRLVPKDALLLKKAASSKDPINLINPYRFAPPLSPNIAARLSGKKIDFRRIKRLFENILSENDVTLIEGAGGLLTPLSGKKTVLDLIRYLNIPAILVTPSRLGCVGQTLLAIRYSKKAGIKIKGVVLSRVSKKSDPSVKYNAEELKNLGTPIMGEMPYLKKGKIAEIENCVNLEKLIPSPYPLPKGERKKKKKRK